MTRSSSHRHFQFGLNLPPRQCRLQPGTRLEPCKEGDCRISPRCCFPGCWGAFGPPRPVPQHRSPPSPPAAGRTTGKAGAAGARYCAGAQRWIKHTYENKKSLAGEIPSSGSSPPSSRGLGSSRGCCGLSLRCPGRGARFAGSLRAPSPLCPLPATPCTSLRPQPSCS